MADNLPTSIKNLNTQLGNQLAEGGGGSSGGGAVLFPYRTELDESLNETNIVDKKLSEIDSSVIGFCNESELSPRLFISSVNPGGDIPGSVECYYIGMGANPNELVPISVYFSPSEDGNSLIGTAQV